MTSAALVTGIVPMSSNFLVPNGTFFVELLAFVLIFYILGRYVIPPINKAMTARQEAIRQEFAEADEAKKKAHEAEEKFTAQIADARKDANRLREEANEQGKQIIEDAKKQAVVEQQKIKDQAQAQIAAERQQALASLRSEVGTLATSLAGRIVGESLDDDERSGRVVARFLADLETMDAAKSAGNGASS
jgi:F-type H+-transporting ATPase subunit b